MPTGPSTAPSPAIVAIDLEDSSWIVGRGVLHTRWSVRLNDAWVDVRDLPGVVSTAAEAGMAFAEDTDDERVIPPGCQYRITHHLRLPVGTRLRKRISTPRELPPRKHARLPATLDDAVWQTLQAFPPLKTRLHARSKDYRVVGNHRCVSERRYRQGRQQQASRRTVQRAARVAPERIAAFAESLCSA